MFCYPPRLSGSGTPGGALGPTLQAGAVLCASWALPGLCVWVSPKFTSAVLLQVPAGLAGRVRGCTCVGPVGLESHLSISAWVLGSHAATGRAPASRRSRRQAAPLGGGGSASRRRGCEPASVGAWGWRLPRVPGQCLLFLEAAVSAAAFSFFKPWVVVPAAPRRCQGSGLACPPRAGG